MQKTNAKYLGRTEYFAREGKNFRSEHKEQHKSFVSDWQISQENAIP